MSSLKMEVPISAGVRYVRCKTCVFKPAKKSPAQMPYCYLPQWSMSTMLMD